MASLTATILMATLAGAATIDFAQPGYINYTTVPGFFLQDDLTTNASTFNYVWQRKAEMLPHRILTDPRRRKTTLA
jgi:hypothetical protein